ncbi:MAG: hypothetical protein JW839_15620 [Candidatus Lokiarchaeota archaeon]|nr:hypothetical protein [Candidatus Lokiarchaeota archaeon]
MEEGRPLSGRAKQNLDAMDPKQLVQLVALYLVGTEAKTQEAALGIARTRLTASHLASIADQIRNVDDFMRIFPETFAKESLVRGNMPTIMHAFQALPDDITMEEAAVHPTVLAACYMTAGDGHAIKFDLVLAKGLTISWQVLKGMTKAEVLALAKYGGGMLAMSDPAGGESLESFLGKLIPKQKEALRASFEPIFATKGSMERYTQSGYGLFDVSYRGKFEDQKGILWEETSKGSYRCILDGVETPYLLMKGGDFDYTRKTMEYHVKYRIAIRMPEIALAIMRQASIGLIKPGTKFDELLSSTMGGIDNEQLPKEFMQYGIIALAVQNEFLTTENMERLKLGLPLEYVDDTGNVVQYDAVEYQKHRIDTVYKGWAGQARTLKVYTEAITALQAARVKNKDMNVIRVMDQWQLLPTPLQDHIENDPSAIDRLRYLPQKFLATSFSGYVIADGMLAVLDESGKIEFGSIVEAKCHVNQNKVQEWARSVSRMSINARFALGADHSGGAVLSLPDGLDESRLVGQVFLFEDSEGIYCNGRRWDVRITFERQDDGSFIATLKYREGHLVAWSHAGFISGYEGFIADGSPAAFMADGIAGGTVQIPVTIARMGATNAQITADITAMIAAINVMFGIQGISPPSTSEGLARYHQFLADTSIPDATARTVKMVDLARSAFGIVAGAPVSDYKETFDVGSPAEKARQVVNIIRERYGHVSLVPLASGRQPVPYAEFVSNNGRIRSWDIHATWGLTPSGRDDRSAYVVMMASAGTEAHHVDIDIVYRPHDGMYVLSLHGDVVLLRSFTDASRFLGNLNMFIGEISNSLQSPGTLARFSLSGTSVTFALDTVGDIQLAGTFDLVGAYTIRGTAPDGSIAIYSSMTDYFRAWNPAPAAHSKIADALARKRIGGGSNMIYGTELRRVGTPVNPGWVAFTTRIPLYTDFMKRGGGVTVDPEVETPGGFQRSILVQIEIDPASEDVYIYTIDSGTQLHLAVTFTTSSAFASVYTSASEMAANQLASLRNIFESDFILGSVSGRSEDARFGIKIQEPVTVLADGTVRMKIACALIGTKIPFLEIDGVIDLSHLASSDAKSAIILNSPIGWTPGITFCITHLERVLTFLETIAHSRVGFGDGWLGISTASFDGTNLEVMVNLANLRFATVHAGSRFVRCTFSMDINEETSSSLTSSPLGYIGQGTSWTEIDSPVGLAFPDVGSWAQFVSLAISGWIDLSSVRISGENIQVDMKVPGINEYRTVEYHYDDSTGHVIVDSLPANLLLPTGLNVLCIGALPVLIDGAAHQQSVARYNALIYDSIDIKDTGRDFLQITVWLHGRKRSRTGCIVYLSQVTHYFYLSEACTGKGYWSLHDAIEKSL